jgi:hypothetical protein
MQAETAKALIRVMFNTLGMAMDCRNKIIAFEKIFSDRNNGLFREYLEILQEVRVHPPTCLSWKEFSKLEKTLTLD